MPLPFSYAVGTASVANGDTTVTFSGALLGTEQNPNIQAGDIFLDPAQSDGFQRRIASVDYDNSTAELAGAWLGTSMTDDAYRVDYIGDIIRSTAQNRRLLEQMSVVEANGRGLFYYFDDGTADADPGSGAFRLNHLTLASATAAYIDNLDANGATVSAVLDTWDDAGSSLSRGQLWVRSIETPSTFRAYTVSGSLVDGTGYRKLTLANVGGSGSFADGDEIMVFFTPAGPQGESFDYDDVAADIAGLAAFEGQAEGFVVLVQDSGDGRAGFYSLSVAGSPAEWTLIAYLTGDTGAQGEKGWSPMLIRVEDGERQVIQLDSYVGGEGDAPTANVGEYLKADGTWTSTIGDALDVRGASFNWRTGGYDNGTAYAKRDALRDQGASWIALQATTGNAPPTLPTTSNAYWELMANKGADGAGTIASLVEGLAITIDAGDPANPEISVDLLDEDDFASDSPTQPPSQQSTKAYVDAAVAGVDLSALEEQIEAMALWSAQIQIQVADNTNLALFLGESGNRYADSFETLTYVDTLNSVNLDTSTPGVLRPTLSGGATVSYRNTYSSESDLSTYSFATSDIGTAAGDRYVIVAVYASTTAGAGAAPSSVTIGGNAATKLGEHVTGSFWSVSIWGLLVTTGATATIAVNWGAGMARTAVSVWATYGASISSPTTLTSSSDPAGGNLTTSSGGLVIAAVVGATSTTLTWTGATENTDGPGSFSNGTLSAASAEIATGSSLAISADSSGAAVNASLFVALSPASAPTPDNATIYLGPFAAAAVPTVAKGLLMVKEVDAAVAGTDYELAVSRDGKANWTDIPLTELYTAPTPTAGIRVVDGADTDISAQPSDDVVWFRFATDNNKMVELHAAYSYWSD